MRKVTKGLVVALATILVLGSGASAAQAATSEPAGDGPQVLIVGGQEAKNLQGEVSIQYGGRHRCGGNLITPQWVLTAGHCADLVIPGETKVRTGSLDWTTGGQFVGVKRVVVNPLFNENYAKGDNALVQLDQPVKARVVPMSLSPIKVGTITRATGWGRTCKDPARPECSVLPNKLQQLDTVIVNPGRCDLGTTPEGVPIFDPATEVCIASADGQAKMVCNGDSGGPLKRKIGGTWFLVATAVADGDDLVPHPNDCNTGPDGVTPGVGIFEKVGPSFKWILSTLLECDPKAARQFASSTRR